MHGNMNVKFKKDLSVYTMWRPRGLEYSSSRIW